IGATLAAIVAAVVSMALGSYLSTRTEVRYYQAQVHREKREMDDMPEEELAEMRHIYRGYGFSEEETEIFLSRFEQDHDLWLNLMLRDELGIIPESFESPVKNAALMALAVLSGSIPPLLPNIILSVPMAAFVWVIWLSALTAFVLGALTGQSTGETWWKSGLSFLAVSSIAAVIGMGAGHFITPLLGVG
ncbi:MAG: VIT1/CCC1 transporter family protein, partial [Thermaerobacter sp.]|nr:VIT1/CCC1 transporter family protein [Thermaerobacter sp.]